MRVVPPILAAVLLAAASPARDADAHPHVWIASRTTFVLADGAVTEIRFRWTFDEFFSGGVLGDFDADRDGRLSPAEVRAVHDGAFAAVASEGYFTDIRIDEERIAVREVRDFGAEAEDGIVSYTFTVPLPRPVDPARHAVSASSYDTTFYVDILPDETTPAVVEGGSCRYRIGPAPDVEIYGGLIVPDRIELDCGPR